MWVTQGRGAGALPFLRERNRSRTKLHLSQHPRVPWPSKAPWREPTDMGQSSKPHQGKNLREAGGPAVERGRALGPPEVDTAAGRRFGR